MYLPNKATKKLAVPQDIQDVFKTVDQAINIELRTSSSINDIVNSDQSLANLILKGFEASVGINMVSNIKKALLEFLQINDDEKVQMLMGPVMMLAPAFLIQVQGNL